MSGMLKLQYSNTIKENNVAVWSKNLMRYMLRLVEVEIAIYKHTGITIIDWNVCNYSQPEIYGLSIKHLFKINQLMRIGEWFCGGTVSKIINV